MQIADLRLRRGLSFALIVASLTACGGAPATQRSAPAASSAATASPASIASTEANATPSTAGAEPSAAASADAQAADIQGAYGPLLLLNASVTALEETAKQAQSGEVKDFELLERIIGAGIVVKAANDALAAEPPLPAVEPVWEDARSTGNDLQDVLGRWMDKQISSADIPGELESIKPRIDTILETAERDLSAAYSIDSAELQRIRTEAMTKLQEGLSSSAATASTPAEASAEPIASEPGMSRAEPLALGTPMVFESWTVTVTEVLRGDAARQAIADANQFNEPPHDGYEYVLATLQIENASEKPEAQSTSLAASLHVTGDRNTAYMPVPVVAPHPFEGELFPGGSATGQQVFEVPAGEGNLMFAVEEMLDFGSTPRFVAIDEGAHLQPDPALDAIAPSESGTSRDAPVALGQAAVTGDWEVSVLETKRGADAATLVQEANQFNEPAEAGTEYVAVRVRVRSIGTSEPDKAQNVGGSWAKLTGANNAVYDNPSVVAPEPRLDVFLYPGGEAEGWTVLSAAEGEQNLLLIWEPLFSFDSSQTRYLALQ